MLNSFQTDRSIFARVQSKICVPLTVEDGKIAGVFSIESCHPMQQTQFNNQDVINEIVNFSRTITEICRTAYWLRHYRV